MTSTNSSGVTTENSRGAVGHADSAGCVVEQALRGELQRLHRRDMSVMVAVSGGLDSMCLWHALRPLASEFQLRLVVAHYNHQWRAEAAADAQHVASLASEWGFPVALGQPEGTPAATQVAAQAAATKRSESQARQLRYDFLKRSALQWGCSVVLTAHTRSDQVETILHHLLRGSGLSGLRGIPPQRRLSLGLQLLRPLLAVSREQLQAYQQQHGVPYRTDASNADQRYTRNRLRHSLLPQLIAAGFPQSETSLIRLADQAAEAADALNDYARKWLSGVTLQQTEQLLRLHLTAAERPPRAVLAMAVRQLWEQQQWPRSELDERRIRRVVAVMSTTQGEPSRFCLPGGIVVERSGDLLILQRHNPGSFQVG